ncbi:hypothetical protein [Sphingobacterium hungaricum]|uniref:DUF4142 domain-containing protein n=1 Tax=Sphingobacterium hungaricum TaxID=2082723 RepID=A0A928YTR8_9SPHI|nr:hypothetical protein [Sphingobacterium hungaricum]MBE8715408.1 hypothetical protein [Sphingobacterium hungaricum]
MKINSIVASVLCASAFFVSCSNKKAEENQVKYTHTTRVDGDAYHFFQVVGTKTPYEVQYAAYANSANSSAKVKEISAEIEKVYGDLLPQLDSLATKFFVDFPIRGAESFAAHTETAATPVSTALDSTSSVAAQPAVNAHAYSDDAYLKHTQHEQAIILDQFTRLSRNTNKVLRDFAADKLHTLEELYKKSGGEIHEGAHH